MRTKINYYLMSLVLLMITGFPALAQFNSYSSQTFFVCNATGTQLSVNAFGDGNGGTYSFWIDTRNGNAGTAIYGQHLDSLGNPLWSPNGKLFYQQNAKEVWLMKAVSWQNGILLGWVQGDFGVGGDTLLCNYYNSNGVSQWSQPTVVANKQGSIIYVSIDDLQIFPNDSGATFTYGLTQAGWNSYFSFNRINFAGALHWPLNLFSYQGGGYYYQTASDNHNGFYVATSTGGFGAHIFVGHFDLQGNLTIPAPVDICGTAGGRNNSTWKVLCDADTNAYIVWASYTNSNISISKIKPNGVMPWNDAKQICAAAGAQENPEAIIRGNTIYAIWADGRPTAVGNYDIYMQKLDSSGTGLWTNDGILISHVLSYQPVPKLAPSGNNIVATYTVTGFYRAQLIHPDSTVSWYQNGIVVNTNNPPLYGDYQLVSSPSGSVTAIWRETNDNICAARIQPNGTLTTIQELSRMQISIYPNPASNEVFIYGTELAGKDVQIKIFDVAGKMVYFENVSAISTGSVNTISLKNFTSGVYTVQVYDGTNFVTDKLIIQK